LGAPDVVVIGGGVIGLSIAYALAAERVSVTVLDAGLPGQASAAAAGMLAPLAEARREGPFVPLAVESLRLWPLFADQLRDESEEETKTTPRIAGPGMLRIARTQAEEAALCDALDWQQGFGLPLRRLNAADLHALEPALGPAVCGGILSPLECSIEPRLLLQALRAACLKRGVVIHSETTVTDFETSKGRVQAAQTANTRISGGAYLITSGAWSQALGLALGVHFPVQPLRGQMLALGPLHPIPFRHILYTHGGYLVPRADGRVIAGTTEERAGFSAQTTKAGIGSIAARATALIPSLSDAPRHSVWAGLRPVSADGLPLLGRVPGWENLHVATGHGRNGILLTPLTARLMTAHLLQEGALPLAFNPARFGGSLCH
jgi:glycine oxidase